MKEGFPINRCCTLVFCALTVYQSSAEPTRLASLKLPSIEKLAQAESQIGSWVGQPSLPAAGFSRYVLSLPMVRALGPLREGSQMSILWFLHAYPDFSGQLIPKSRQGPVNIGPKIFLGRSETGGDFFLSPVFRLFNAFPRRNRPVVAPQGGGKTRSAAPEFGFNSDGLENGSVTTTPCASRNTAASELQQHLHGVFQSGLRRPPAYEPQLRLVHEGAYAREQGVCLH